MSATSHLWVLIHKHQSEIQTVLGPVATLAAAGAATFVTWRIGRVQANIAASQRDIAKMRVRMDLLKDRLKVSRATFDLMKGCLSGMAANNPDFDRLRRAVRQHPFFFPAEVSSVVDAIDTDCVSLAVQHQARNLYSPGNPALADAERKVAQHIDRWPAPFGEVMSFKDVD